MLADGLSVGVRPGSDGVFRYNTAYVVQAHAHRQQVGTWFPNQAGKDYPSADERSERFKKWWVVD